MHVADYDKLGLVPLRDHDPDARLFCRSVVYGAAVAKREDVGRYELENSVGDLNCALHFDKSSRDILGWAFAWPVAVGAPVSPNLGGSGGGGASNGSYRLPNGGVVPGVPRNSDGTLSDFRAGPFVGPADSVRPGLRDPVTTQDDLDAPPPHYRPIRGGARYAVDPGFASRTSKGPASWPGFPGGYVGVAIAGTEAGEERPVFLSGDPRIPAVNAAGDPRMSAQVVDLDASSAFDHSRRAPIHSMMRVILRPNGGLSWGPRNPIAWNLLGGGQDGTAGYGLYFDMLLKAGRKGEITPTEPEPRDGRPVTTPSDNPSGPVEQIHHAGENVDGQNGTPTRDQTNFSNFSFPSVEVAITPSPATTAAQRDSTSAKAGPGLATTSYRGSGPFHPGTQDDKHQLGKDGDGHKINAGHLSTNAYFFAQSSGTDYDAPLEFQMRGYPKPPELPYKSRVHLVMDYNKEHDFTLGSRKGLWRWYAEYDTYMPPTGPPPTTQPPRKPPQTPPPPTTPSDPPQPPTTPSEPGAPPGPGPVTPPPGGGPTPRPPDPTRPTPGNPDPKAPPWWHGPDPGVRADFRGTTFYAATGRAAIFAIPQAFRRGAGLPLADHSIEDREAFPYAAAVRPRDSYERPQQFLRSTAEKAYTALLFIPQSQSRADADLRRSPNPVLGQVSRQEFAPVTVRMEAWGGQVAGEWLTTYGPGRGKYGRSGPGGILFTSPEVDVSDYASLYSPQSTSRSTSYVGVAPGTYFALGLPNLLTGGLKTGYRLGHDGLGVAKFEALDSSGTATNVLRLTAGGAVDLAAALRISSAITPSLITADQDDYAPTGFATATILKLSTNADGRKINSLGATAPTDGDVKIIENVGSHTLVIVDSAGSGTSAMKFLLHFGAATDLTISPHEQAGFVYDASSTKWKLLFGPSSPGPIGLTLIGVQFLTGASGTYDPATNGATSFRVRVLAEGGGGGGSAGAGAQSSAAAGGASGGYAEKWYSTVGGTYSWTQGNAGGAGGGAGNNPGTAGADSTFDTITVKGGAGGAGAPSIAGAVFGTTNNTAPQTGTTGGDFNSDGNPGFGGIRLSTLVVLSGNGACSPFGGGGNGNNNNSAGANATGFGGGGGGASSIGNTNNAGGNGSPGLIMIEEYA